MWRAVSEFQAGYIVMHAQGTPPTMQDHPTYENIVREVGEFFSERLETLLNAAGIAAEQVVFDPGIGFGKTAEHNLQLLAGLRSFTKRRRPLLLGVSRKSFIGKLLGADVENRLPASLACATLAVAAGVNFIRTHDVAETVQAVRMAEAILSRNNHVD
jgi:dihydropteroate synthase